MNSKNKDTQEVVLCVDLDGTLIRSDLLLEGILLMLKANMFSVFRLFAWLMRGKIYFKKRVAAASKIDPVLLPYNAEFLSFLLEEHGKGRRIALVTASHSDYARVVVDHLEIFETYFATTDAVNLSGKQKADLLVREFGQHNFDYAGNEGIDLAIWRKARKAILVSSSERLARKVAEIGNLGSVYPGHRVSLVNYVKMIRVHQWIKNVLIFVPLFAAHEYTNFSLVADCVIAFVCLNFCASATYVVNDLLDLNVDRKHPEKRKRTLASGELPLMHGVLAVPVLILFGFGIATYLPIVFSFGLAGYILLTTIYTMLLKKVIAIDVFVLTLLFTYRILLGSMVTLILPSFWLLAFSMFIFLSLAFVKRYSELHALQGSSEQRAAGRGYQISDLSTVLAQGTGSGYAATLVLALYVNDPSINALYASPYVLWGLCILLLYWITRLWLKCARGEIHNDPIVFAVTDRQSLIIAVIGAAILYMATVPGLYST